MMRATALGILLLTACASPELATESQDLNLPQFALVFGLGSKASLVQSSTTAWTLTKTAAVDTGAKTVTWNITSTKGATTGNKLTVDGYLDVLNLGTGPATLGNIVVNLQAKQGSHWVTLSSDVADATQDDAATSAHVVGANTTEGQSLFTENTASGKLSFTDRRFNTMFSLVPEASIQPWTDLPLVFSASYDNTVLNLATSAQLRFEVVVTFGNHPLGGPNHTDENVDINGNGIIDADEHKVRSLIALFEKSVPAATNANSTLALSDAPSDITTTGTVTFTNPTINLGTTTGTVKVSYDPGTSGGSVTNCVHGTGTGVSQTVGSYTFVDVAPLVLQTCTTATIAQPACTPGTTGCGWHDGDLISYDQDAWGGTPAPNTAAGLLSDEYDTVYASTSGVLHLGIYPSGFYMEFTNKLALLGYLPQFGVAAALNANLVDTTSSSSGIFGGQVGALHLNIDFTDANQLAGTATTVKFGDLHLCGLTTTTGLNGSTIRQLEAIADTSLGGGSTPYAIADLSALLQQVNDAFQGGFVSTFAQAHVVNGACP